jgi:hypothetical protein
MLNYGHEKKQNLSTGAESHEKSVLPTRIHTIQGRTNHYTATYGKYIGGLTSVWICEDLLQSEIEDIPTVQEKPPCSAMLEHALPTTHTL